MACYQFGLLRVDRVTELQKSLELIVLGERDYLHDCAELGENLDRPTNQMDFLLLEQMKSEGHGGEEGLPAAAHPELQGRTCCRWWCAAQGWRLQLKPPGHRSSATPPTALPTPPEAPPVFASTKHNLLSTLFNHIACRHSCLLWSPLTASNVS